MWRRRLFWKLFATYALVIVFCLVAVGGYLVRSERREARLHLETDLAQRARILDERMGPLLEARYAATADSIVKAIGVQVGTRITLIAPDGRVLADSDVDPAHMENHRYRPEVQAALTGGTGSAVRYSTSAFADFLYVATPSHARPGWVVRVAIPLQTIRARERGATSILVAGAAWALGLAGLLGFLSTRRLTRPLERMASNLERLERGELGIRFDASSNDEIGQLARTLNRTKERLEMTISGLTSQRNQREAILSSMVEGLIAVDGQDRILLVNSACRAVLGIGSTEEQGRSLLEVVRLPQLVSFIESVRNASQPLGAELVMRDPRPRYLELHGAPLRLGEGGAVGAVVVFNDVTRLRKLEEVRKEFVANVSHELKTPITSIKGFLETLLEGGALEDRDSARRFLGIISRQSDRLAAIIEDLLYLSRLEHEEKQIALHRVDLGAVAERCIINFEHAARHRGVDLHLQVETPHRWVMGDGSLLARALDNLIDNALKYSNQGGKVEVALRNTPDHVLLQVSDQGPGIPEEHLPRISERFYRVDTARSREMGGTGLGLAIVKHVARVHSGSLDVDSRLGEGSCFTLRLPQAPNGTG